MAEKKILHKVIGKKNSCLTKLPPPLPQFLVVRPLVTFINLAVLNLANQRSVGRMREFRIFDHLASGRRTENLRSQNFEHESKMFCCKEEQFACKAKI